MVCTVSKRDAAILVVSPPSVPVSMKKLLSKKSRNEVKNDRESGPLKAGYFGLLPALYEQKLSLSVVSLCIYDRGITDSKKMMQKRSFTVLPFFGY
jgi:hypothetical protein